MSVGHLLIAPRVFGRLLPDKLEALEILLERQPLPAPGGCIVPLTDLRR